VDDGWGVTDEETIDINVVGAPNETYMPADLVARVAAEDKITLTWKDVCLSETGYSVERSEDGTDGSYYDTIGVLPANSTTYTDTGLTEGATYYYRVCAYSDEGES
jgi:hypothetical protein